jgi:hypothetical protein
MVVEMIEGVVPAELSPLDMNQAVRVTLRAPIHLLKEIP